MYTLRFKRQAEATAPSVPAPGPLSRNIIDEQQPSTSSYLPTSHLVRPAVVAESQEDNNDSPVENAPRASQPDELSQLGGRFLQLSSDERRSLLTQRRDEMISKARQRYLQKRGNNNDL